MQRLFARPAAVAFLLALLLGVLRRPEQLFRPVAVIEEGAIYLARAIAEGPLSIFAPYAGAPRLLPRLIGLLESLVPPAIAPAIGSAAALLVIAAIAAIIASQRLAHLVPSAPLRMALGLLVVLVPGADEQHGLMVDVERYLPLGALALLYARPLAGRWARLAERAAFIVAISSGATAVVIAPLYLMAAWRPSADHDRRELPFRLAAISFGLAAIVASLLLDPRGSTPLTPLVAVAGTAVHAVVAVLGAPVAVAVDTFLGRWPLVLLGSGLLLAGTAITIRLLPHRRAIDLLLLVLSTLGAGALSMDPYAAPVWDDPRVAHRYAFLLGPILVGLLLLAYRRLRRTRDHLLGVIAGAVAISGIVAGFRLFPFPEGGYGAAAGCLGGDAPCSVPAYPPAVWTIEWPGSDQPYLEPRPGHRAP